MYLFDFVLLRFFLKPRQSTSSVESRETLRNEEFASNCGEKGKLWSSKEVGVRLPFMVKTNLWSPKEEVGVQILFMLETNLSLSKEVGVQILFVVRTNLWWFKDFSLCNIPFSSDSVFINVLLTISRVSSALEGVGSVASMRRMQLESGPTVQFHSISSRVNGAASLKITSPMLSDGLFLTG